jgi:dihydroxyacetone kinase
MLKGLRAASAPGDEPIVKAFRKAAGGASGSLFAQIIEAFDKVLNEQVLLGEALDMAAERIFMLGQAKIGDKTMLDALIPAAKAARSAQENPDMAALAALKAAQQGVEATRAMTANRGRARYVEGAGAGHLDAGAVSVAHMLEVFVHYLDSEKQAAKI